MYFAKAALHITVLLLWVHSLDAAGGGSDQEDKQHHGGVGKGHPTPQVAGNPQDFASFSDAEKGHDRVEGTSSSPPEQGIATQSTRRHENRDVGGDLKSNNKTGKSPLNPGASFATKEGVPNGLASLAHGTSLSYLEVADLSLEDSADLISNLIDSVYKSFDDLEDLRRASMENDDEEGMSRYSSSFPEELADIIFTSTENTEAALVSAKNVVKLMRNLAEHDTSTKIHESGRIATQDDDIDLTSPAALSTRASRRAQRMLAEDEQNRARKTDSTHSTHNKNSHSRFKNAFKTEQPFTSHHHRRLLNMHNAFSQGDYQKLFDAASTRGRGMTNTGSLHRKGVFYGGGLRGNRALSVESDPMSSKENQCRLLVECAGGMSLYDAFLYFHSDDIDLAGGTIDDNVFSFDESDLRQKFDSVKALISVIESESEWSSGTNAACNELLQLFHRTVEHGSIPEFVPATVSQVCLAEGTTVFVEMKDIARVLVNFKSLDGFEQGNVALWRESVDLVLGTTVKDILLEPFQCAEELFFSQDRISNAPHESFVFKGCEGSGSSSDCTIDKYRFPTALNIATKNETAPRYFTKRDQVQCGQGQQITTPEECAIAGVAVGGVFRPEGVVVGNWGHTPCGCFGWGFNGEVHFSTSATCQNRDNHGSVICKENPANVYEQVGKNLKSCPPGYGEIRKEDCLAAGVTAGAESMAGSLLEIDRNDVPSGCIVLVDNRVGGTGMERWRVHWNLNPSGASHLDVNQVCERVLDSLFEKQRYSNTCPEGRAVAKEVCEQAGLEIGGSLRDEDGQGGAAVVGSWGWTPCGCFVTYDTGHIHWNTQTTGCVNDGRFDGICRKMKPATAARDRHGELIWPSKEPSFVTNIYNDFKALADSCEQENHQSSIEDCQEEFDIASGLLYRQCLIEKRAESQLECFGDELYDKIQTSLELVFGANPSPGFLCGIKEYVVKSSGTLPGSCCLDTPYELEDDDWGRPYNCAKPCKKRGPYFAGLAKESCDAHGGTWCPAPVNCTVLKDCVQSMIDAATIVGQAGFRSYLEGAPAITSPTDIDQCGSARQYFGFDELFVNDNQICEDIGQFRYTKDFDFLDEFFAQGSNTGSNETVATGTDLGPAGDPPPEEADVAPELLLTAPDRTLSAAPAVKNGATWRQTNGALRKGVDGVSDVKETLASFNCPADFFAISDAICAVAMNIAFGIAQINYVILDNIVFVSETAYEVSSGSLSAIMLEEDGAAVFDNMQATADYLVGIHQAILTTEFDILNDMADRFEGHGDNLAIVQGDIIGAINDVCGARRVLLHEEEQVPGLMPDGKDYHDVAHQTRNKAQPHFDVEVTIVSHFKPRTLYVVPKVQGVAVGYDDVFFSFQADDPESGERIAVAFEYVEVQNGLFEIVLSEDTKGNKSNGRRSSHVVMTAHFLDGLEDRKNYITVLVFEEEKPVWNPLSPSFWW